jgi:hypothetical protein
MSKHECGSLGDRGPPDHLVLKPDEWGDHKGDAPLIFFQGVWTRSDGRLSTASSGMAKSVATFFLSLHHFNLEVAWFSATEHVLQSVVQL